MGQAQPEGSNLLVTDAEVTTPAWGKTRPQVAVVRTRADLRRQYLLSDLNAVPGVIRNLPEAFDEVTCKHGVAAYRRMRDDYEVRASLGLLTMAITAQEPVLVPAVGKDEDGGKKALEIADFFAAEFDEQERTLVETLQDMCVAFSEGHSLVEIAEHVHPSVNFSYGMSKLAGKIGIKSLLKKPLESYKFAVDASRDIVGVIPVRLGTWQMHMSYLPVREGEITDLSWALPRDKFIIFSCNPENNDPRGTSLLSAAYSPWYIKQCVFTAWMKYVLLNGNPILAGTVGPDAMDVCELQADGSEITITATEQLRNTLQRAGPGSRLAFANGTKVEYLQAHGAGEAFIKLVDATDKAIIRSILGQHLATGTQAAAGRSAAETHKDALNLMIQSWKMKLAQRIRRDLFVPFVIRNWGERYKHLAPYLDLGDGDGFAPLLGEVLQFVAMAPQEAVDWSELGRRYKLPVLENFETMNVASGGELAAPAENGQPAEDKRPGDKAPDNPSPTKGTIVAAAARSSRAGRKRT